MQVSYSTRKGGWCTRWNSVKVLLAMFVLVFKQESWIREKPSAPSDGSWTKSKICVETAMKPEGLLDLRLFFLFFYWDLNWICFIPLSPSQLSYIRVGFPLSLLLSQEIELCIYHLRFSYASPQTNRWPFIFVSYNVKWKRDKPCSILKTGGQVLNLSFLQHSW